MNDASGQPVIIEVALNGGKTREAQPHVPLTPGELGGARRYRLPRRRRHDRPQPHRRPGGRRQRGARSGAVRGGVARDPRRAAQRDPLPDGGRRSGAHTNVEERYGHVHALAATGVLGMGLVDPGTRNVGGLDANGLPRAVNLTYQNTFADARYMFDACRDLGVGVSISIFEPGFLRVVLAYHRAGALPPGVMVKLYFGSGEFSFGLPPTVPSLEAYLAMLEGTEWSSVARVGARRWRRGRLRSRARSVRARWTRPGRARALRWPARPDQRRADRGGRDGRLRGRTNPIASADADRRDPRAAELPRRPDAAVRRGVGNGRARPAGRRR